jgi:hypothetical protein
MRKDMGEGRLMSELSRGNHSGMNTRALIRPLPSRSLHALHVARGGAKAVALIFASLVLGAAGYHWFEGLPWIDAQLNASMILTGMGPLDHPVTEGGKLFASAYALYSGIVFLSTATLILGPVLKRGLHTLHLDMHAPTPDGKDD